MSWHFLLIQVLAYGVMLGAARHVRRQTTLDDAARKDYFGIIALNFCLCMGSLIFYAVCRDNFYYWSITHAQQDYGIFYQLGIQRGDWLAVAVAKYFCCSLVVLVLLFFISALNYLLLQRLQIDHPKTRAVALALMCSGCFMTATAYGCYLFYAARV